MKDPIIIPQGGFVVINKHNTTHETILSPAVQCGCMVVALRSEYGVALAHMDAAALQQGTATLRNMLKELKAMGDGQIRAELIGGDFGDPLNNSSSLHRSLTHELRSKNISYQHRTWHADPSFALAMIGLISSCLALRDEGLTGVIGSMILSSILYTIVKLLPVVPLFNMGSHDVSMSIATGQISCIPSKEGEITLAHAQRNFPGFFDKIKGRWQDWETNDRPLINFSNH